MSEALIPQEPEHDPCSPSQLHLCALCPGHVNLKKVLEQLPDKQDAPHAAARRRRGLAGAARRRQDGGSLGSIESQGGHRGHDSQVRGAG